MQFVGYTISTIIVNGNANIKPEGYVQSISFYNQGSSTLVVKGRKILPFSEWTPFVAAFPELDETNGYEIVFDESTGDNNQCVITTKAYRQKVYANS